MRFNTVYGGIKSVKRPKKYLIDWSSSSRSKIQNKVKKFLKPHWSHHVVFEEFPIPATRLSLDFLNATKNIAVEVQGNQHIKYIPFFHQSRTDFLKQMKRDQIKENFCKINNITLVLIYQDDDISLELFETFGVKLS